LLFYKVDKRVLFHATIDENKIFLHNLFQILMLYI
jgi:hypothetical protein